MKWITEENLVLCAIQDYPFEANGLLNNFCPIPFTHSRRKKRQRQIVYTSKKDYEFIKKCNSTIQFHSHPLIRKDAKKLYSKLSKEDKEQMKKGTIEVVVSLAPFKVSGDLGKGITGKLKGYHYIIRAFKKNGKIEEVELYR